MKLQDLHPYDSFIVGILNIYFVDYKGNFHIQAKFIMVDNETLSTGCTYVLIESFNTKKYIVRQVRLQDAFYSDGSIFLLVKDISSLETFIIDQQIKCTRDHFKWVLIDLDDIDNVLNTEVIKSYCNSCGDDKKKYPSDKNLGKFSDDLLEFDF